MTTVVPDPETNRSPIPTKRYRANPATAPSSIQIEQALQSINQRCAAAAKQSGGGIPPEIDVIIVSRGDGTSTLYIRLYEHGLLDDIEILTGPLPDSLTQGTGSLVEAVSTVTETHSEVSDIEYNDEYLAKNNDLASALLDASDQLLTVRPARIPQPVADSDTSMSQPDTAVEADWELDWPGINNELDATYDSEYRPDSGFIRDLVESVEEIEVDIVCQLHLEFSYDVGGEVVTASRAANISGTLDPEDPVEPSEELGFGFRLFSFSDQGVEIDDELKRLGKKIAPRFPERYTPAIHSSGKVLERHVRRLFFGQGIKQSERHNQIYRRPLTAMKDWLVLPQQEDWYSAARFLPIEQRFLTDNTEDGLIGAEYPLGEDTALSRWVTTPTDGPYRHIVHSNSSERRREYLSEYIDISREVRTGPVIVLDWSGQLCSSYFSRYSDDERDEILNKHALIDISEMPLATQPRQISTDTTLVGQTKSHYTIDQAEDLYNQLLFEYLGSIDPSPKEHFDDVIAAFSSLDQTAFTHSDLVDEIQAHCPRTSAGTTESPRARRATATSEWFDAMHDSLPIDLFGDLSEIFDFTLGHDVPSDGVIWLDLTGIATATAKRMAATILLDAIAQHVSLSSQTGVGATVVFDHLNRISVTETVKNQFLSHRGDVSQPSGLALLAGSHLTDSPQTRSPLETGAVHTVDTVADPDGDATEPPAAPGSRKARQHQHGSAHSIVVLPPELRVEATRRKTLAPVASITTDVGSSGGDRQTLRTHGETLTPDSVSAGVFTQTDWEPKAVHPSRQVGVFDTGEENSDNRDENQLPLGSYSKDITDDRFACPTCGTRYEAVIDAILCHDNQRIQGTPSQSTNKARTTAYPETFLEYIDFTHGDSLTEFFRTAITAPEPRDRDDVLSRIREGISKRMDSEDGSEHSLDELQFLQAVEAKRVGILPFDERSMIELRDRCLLGADPLDEILGESVEAENMANAKYYSLTDDGENLSQITTFSSTSTGSTIPGLDDTYPTNGARAALAASFNEQEEIARTEIIHYPNTNQRHSFPLKAIDVAGFNQKQQLVKVGLVLSPETVEIRVTREMLAWAVTIPAEVTLVVEDKEVTQYLAQAASATEYLDLDRNSSAPLTKTEYQTSKIIDWMSWQYGSGIEVRPLSSVTD